MILDISHPISILQRIPDSWIESFRVLEVLLGCLDDPLQQRQIVLLDILHLQQGADPLLIEPAVELSDGGIQKRRRQGGDIME